MTRPFPSPHSRSVIGAQTADNDNTQYLGMRTQIDHQRHQINPADARRRQIRVMQAIFAGTATIATLALFSAAKPGHAESAVASGSSVRLVDQAADLPAPATAPFGPQFPRTALNMVGNGGLATDDNTSTSNGGGDDYTPGNYSGGWVNNDFPSVDPPPPSPPSPGS